METPVSDKKEEYGVRIEKRNNKEKVRWENWKSEAYKKGILDISEENSTLLLNYLKNMEVGLNISSKSCKGARSPRRLNDMKDRMIIFCKWFEKYYSVRDLSKLTEVQIFGLFHDIKEGSIKTKNGDNYKSIDTLAKAFKSFWHWHVKISRKNSIIIDDLTQDLDAKGEKPDWVYLDEKQLWQLANSASFEHKVLIMFLIDTGLRPPLELLPIRVSDLYNNCTELNIKVHKKNSFPRRIKLMLCTELLKEYIQIKKKKPEDYLFEICPEVINRNLKKYAIKLFGDKVSLAGHEYSKITMYDFRHNSCCYWLNRYKSEAGLKYRFGWKKSDKIYYYSELLGAKDTITQDDLLVDTTKTELENRIGAVERENELLKEKVLEFEKYMKIIDELSREIEKRAMIVKS